MIDFPLSRTASLYRRLIALLLPAAFHGRYAHQMLDVFAEVDAAARQRHGALGGWRALVAELPGLVGLALRERRRAPITLSLHTKASMFASLAQDLRFAARTLRRSPGFALVAVLTIALGVGANTAIFSVVNGVLLKPLPIDDPGRVYAVGEQSTGTPGQISVTSPANLFDWQRSVTSMEIAGYYDASGTITGRGEPQQLSGIMSVGGLFQVLGLRPMLGRALTVADEDPAVPGVVVLSYETWRQLFGEDRAAIGQTITVNGTARTIVGVMPAGYTFLGSSAAFYGPARFDPKVRQNRDQYFITTVGRLRRGETIERARTELETIAARLRRDWPLYNASLVLLAKPLQEIVVGSTRPQLLVLMGAVAFLLLITCANLGSLLLARATVRRREMAVRQALGAGQGRVARQLLTESVLLALIGGALGALVGRGFLALLMAADAATNLPRAQEVALDGRVLAFTFGVSLVAGIIFGSIPAWQLSRGDSSEVLRGSKGSARGTFARSTLVVAELGLAMMLLIGAGLLLRSFDLLQRVNPGVRPERVLTFTVGLPRENLGFFDRALDRIRVLPGVTSAAVASQLPVSGRGIGAWFNRVDKPIPASEKPTGESYRVVTPDFFSAMGIGLRRGRLLTAGDRREAPVVVVNEALVKRYYPNEDPIGKPIYLGAPDNRLFPQGTIVGVVGDTRDAGLGADPLPIVYIPLAVMPGWRSMSFVVRTSGEPASVVASTRAVIRDLDAGLPVRNVRTMEEVLAAAVAPTRWSSTLLGVFAAIALVIAVLGVFGVLSFIVTQRTRELGIRVALGATPERLRRIVMRRALGLAALGVLLGGGGAALLTRYMGSLLFGVTATDTVTYATVAGVLLLTSALASYLPARRATRVEPVQALRAE